MAQTRERSLPTNVAWVIIWPGVICGLSLLLVLALISHGGHFESQENKKLCFCTCSLALDERLDMQNLLFQHCVINVYCFSSGFSSFNPPQKPTSANSSLIRIENLHENQLRQMWFTL